ncbi:MAG: exodeoxyribonuclease VII small subunit [Tannerellaceae bacterium]|nr:exodeoxyribonuclease VII small subunit [Tannerellaceae bacterium]
MDDNQSNYNQDMASLRELVSEIENEELDIDFLMEKVKEASMLIKRCKAKLYVVDEEVKKVLLELEE